MEKNSEGATNYEIFSATTVDRRKKIFISNRLRARKTLYFQKAVNVNFHHKYVFIKKLFRVNS